MEWTVETLKQQLSENVCMVTFTKVDGTTRKMRATRIMDLIPSEKLPKGSAKDTTAVRAFDTEIQGWRSIRPESVQSVEVVA